MAKGKTDGVITTELTLERDTKRTYVFKSADENAAVTSLYVQKDAYSGAEPAKKYMLTLTPIA